MQLIAACLEGRRDKFCHEALADSIEPIMLTTLRRQLLADMIGAYSIESANGNQEDGELDQGEDANSFARRNERSVKIDPLHRQVAKT